MIMMRKSCRRDFSLPRRDGATLKVKESSVTEAKFKGVCDLDDEDHHNHNYHFKYHCTPWRLSRRHLDDEDHHNHNYHDQDHLLTRIVTEARFKGVCDEQDLVDSYVMIIMMIIMMIIIVSNGKQ